MRAATRTALAAAGFLAVAATVLTAAGAAAHGYRLGTITIGHIWAKPADAGDMVSVFGPILNGGETPIRLVGVTSAEAGHAGICVEPKGDALEWRDAATIAPHKALALAAWREHICVENLRHALKAGESLKLRLEFDKAGAVDVEAVIEAGGGAG